MNKVHLIFVPILIVEFILSAIFFMLRDCQCATIHCTEYICSSLFLPFFFLLMLTLIVYISIIIKNQVFKKTNMGFIGAILTELVLIFVMPFTGLIDCTVFKISYYFNKTPYACTGVVRIYDELFVYLCSLTLLTILFYIIWRVIYNFKNKK
jgi:hypothetical protein